jgi:hypothetical protein
MPALLRPLPLIALFLLSACTPAATVPPAPVEKQFVLADPTKYKTAQERELALQMAQNDCRAKAMSAGETLRKTIMSESQGAALRARDESHDMYVATFISCMNKAGFIAR